MQSVPILSDQLNLPYGTLPRRNRFTGKREREREKEHLDLIWKLMSLQLAHLTTRDVKTVYTRRVFKRLTRETADYPK